MSQVKLTKTQIQLLTLLSKGAPLVDCAIDGRTFSFETVLTLQRRRLVEEDISDRGAYGTPEFYASPRKYVITEKGKTVLTKGGLVPKKLSKRQKEVLLDCAQGLNIILEKRDGWAWHYQGERTVDTLTISILSKQGFLRKLDPDQDNRVLGSGYTITEKGLALVSQDAS